MLTVLLVFHLIVVISLVGVILLQRSEGGALGALGGGSGLSLISGRSAGNFLTKMTAILATLFMLSCIVLTIMNKNISKEKAVSAVDAASEIIIQETETIEKVTPPVAGNKKDTVNEAPEKEDAKKAIPPTPVENN